MENGRSVDPRSGSARTGGRAGKQDILEQAAGGRRGERSRGKHAGDPPNFCSATFMLGAVQENGWAFEGFVSHTQFAR